MRFLSNSIAETKAIGRQIAATLRGGDCVLLYGDLGAGKTALVKAMAEYFGVAENRITSPTFTLLNLYKIKNSEIKNLAHIDTYRLENEKELIEIGVEDYLGEQSTITFIEWPEKLKELLKNKKIIKIILKQVDNDKREITVLS